MTWFGAIRASTKDIVKGTSSSLQKSFTYMCIYSNNVFLEAINKGKSIGISTGGIAELFESNKNHETIIIKNRKGIIRIAFKTVSQEICHIPYF